MKKYRVTFKSSGKVLGEYASKEEASEKLMWNIRSYNACLGSEGEYLSRFDFLIEEVESTSICDIVTDNEQAKKVLGGKKNPGNVSQRKCVAKPLDGINPKHIEALIAIYQLFTIAEAWNKKDKFVPDFRNQNQYKYYPWFQYDTFEKSFIYDHTSRTLSGASACFGCRLCFKTMARAEQFGKQFIELYNKVFLINK